MVQYFNLVLDLVVLLSLCAGLLFLLLLWRRTFVVLQWQVAGVVSFVSDEALLLSFRWLFLHGVVIAPELLLLRDVHHQVLGLVIGGLVVNASLTVDFPEAFPLTYLPRQVR